MKRVLQGLTLLLSGVALLGCDGGPAGSCEPAGPLAGTWSYTAAVGPSGVGLQRKGTLEIEPEACPGLRGKADLIVIGITGTSTDDSGPVYGTIVPGGARLILDLKSGRIEHAAVLQEGVLWGNWEVRDDQFFSSGQLLSSGTFEAIRKTSP